jgi:hypothetical protein
MNSDNVVIFPGTEEFQPAEVGKVLDDARDLDAVMVIGWQPNGDLRVTASEADIPDLLFLLEIAKQHLLSCVKRH